MKTFSIFCIAILLLLSIASDARGQAEGFKKTTEQAPVVNGRPLAYWLGILQSAESDAKSRRDAATALGKLQVENSLVLAALSHSAESEDRLLRLAAIRSLKQQGSAAVPALQEQLDSSDQSIQVAALEILGQLGPKAIGALPKLLTLIENKMEPVYVRHNAVQCLAAIGGQSAQTTVDRLHALLRAERNKLAKDYWNNAILRHRIIGALPRLGPRADVAIPTLVEMLEHPIPGEKRYLTKRGEPSAMGFVLPILRHDDNGIYTDPRDIETMYLIGSLASFGPAADEALPILRKIVEDSTMLIATQELATKAIARIEEDPK